MATFKRPGVFAEEILLSPQNVSGGSTVVQTAAFVGTNGRGPVVPTFLSSWTQYVSLFGGFSGSYLLPHALFQYFANQGQGVYVTRVAGVGATTAGRSLFDRGGSAQLTLRLDAQNPGAWGNTLYLDVADYGASGSGRFQITVHFGDATSTTIVERWTDLSMNPTDSRYVVNVINAANGNGSNYVVATDLLTSNGLSVAAPAVQAGTVLAGGADGTAAGTNEYQAAINTLDQVTVPLIVNLPGVSDTTTLTFLINYANNRQGQDTFVVCDTAVGLTASGAISATAALPAIRFGGIFWPWGQVSDPSVATSGVVKLVPPGGAVVGQFVRTDVTRGPFKAAAGLENRLAGWVGLENKATNADLDSLNTAVPPINAIRNLRGRGPTIYGARTLDTSTGNIYIPVVRSLQYMKHNIRELLQIAVFEPNDRVLWDRLKNDVTAFLTDYWQEGGLRGDTPAQAFYVKCDATINTNAVVQAGQVVVEVGVAVQNPAEFVILRIGQTNGDASITAANS